MTSACVRLRQRCGVPGRGTLRSRATTLPDCRTMHPFASKYQIVTLSHPSPPGMRELKVSKQQMRSGVPHRHPFESAAKLPPPFMLTCALCADVVLSHSTTGIFKDNYPPPGSIPVWCKHANATEAAGAGLAMAPIGCSFEGWQAAGYDRRSQIVDPQFVNAAAGDFRLLSTSPALAMGIVSVDVSTVGPRP